LSDFFGATPHTIYTFQHHARRRVFRYYALVPHAYRHVRRRFASRLNLRCALPGKLHPLVRQWSGLPGLRQWWL